MNEVSANRTSNDDGDQLLPWPDCDIFCIRGYADAGVGRCGWRGRIDDASRDGTGTKLLCPHCGCATLLRIPKN